MFPADSPHHSDGPARGNLRSAGRETAMELTSRSSMRGGLIRCALLMGFLISPAAMAAGNYSQNFSSEPSDWSEVTTLASGGPCSVADPWSATSGYYTN